MREGGGEEEEGRRERDRVKQSNTENIVRVSGGGGGEEREGQSEAEQHREHRESE